MIDSSDRERIEEVHEEMSRMLNEDGIREAAVLLIANKQDLPNAMTLEGTFLQCANTRSAFNCLF